MGSNAYGTPTAIHVAVLDSITLLPWSAEQINLGQSNIPGANNGGPYENYFVFYDKAYIHSRNFSEGTVASRQWIDVPVWCRCGLCCSSSHSFAL